MCSKIKFLKFYGIWYPTVAGDKGGPVIQTLERGVGNGLQKTFFAALQASLVWSKNKRGA